METFVGDATVTFADGNRATFAYTVNGTTQAKAVTRQVFVAPGTVCTSPPPPLTTADAWRLLNQATFGASQAELARLMKLGIAGWIDDQFDRPVSGYPDSVYNRIQLKQTVDCGTKDAAGANYLTTAPEYICWRDHLTPTGLQRNFFTNAVRSSDQLRQRVAWALSQIHVVVDDRSGPRGGAPDGALPEPPVRGGVRQLRAPAAEGDAVPGDGQLPRHGQQRQAERDDRPGAERELRPRGPAALRDRPRRARQRRHGR